MTDKCRREFEEWATDKCFNIERRKCGAVGQYIYSETLHNWVGFQAAYDKRTKDAEELVELLGMMTETAETYLNLLGGVKHPWQYEQLRQAKHALAKWKGK